jgi:hypothetical protein
MKHPALWKGKQTTHCGPFLEQSLHAGLNWVAKRTSSGEENLSLVPVYVGTKPSAFINQRDSSQRRCDTGEISSDGISFVGIPTRYPKGETEMPMGHVTTIAWLIRAG